MAGSWTCLSMPTLVDRNGWLYVVDESPRFNEPVVDFLFYPVGLRTVYFTAHRLRALPITLRSVPSDVGYDYIEDSVTTGTMAFTPDPIRVRLVDGGSTKAEYIETVTLPKPRAVRGEIRWRNGQWEKFMKKAGWVYTGVR